MPKRSALDPPRVAVLGAGASGLAAAYTLLERDPRVQVDVFEASHRIGGCVLSASDDGFTFDVGANSMTTKHASVHDLVHEKLKLGPRMVYRNPGMQRVYIVKDGSLEALPASIPAFFTSKLLSLRAKARVFLEPFVPRRKSATVAENESMQEFFSRRFGREVVENVVDAGIAGIYAGRLSELSMRHSFTNVWELERKAGSVIGGLIRGAGKKTPPDPAFPNVDRKALRESFNFDQGLEVLTNSLGRNVAASPRASIRCKSPVDRLDWNSSKRGWIVNGRRTPYDVIISTIPAHSVAGLRTNNNVAEEAFSTLGKSVSYAPVSIAVLGYKKQDVKHALDGFGALVPTKERRGGLLGLTFTSSTYPGRATRPDEVLLTAFIGGNRNPDKALLPAQDIVEYAAAEAGTLLGMKGARPIFSRVKTWSQGIPQYVAGVHQSVLNELRAAEVKAPGLLFAGNYREGVGVPDALRSGMAAAERALSKIERKKKDFALVVKNK